MNAESNDSENRDCLLHRWAMPEFYHGRASFVLVPFMRIWKCPEELSSVMLLAKISLY